MIGNELRAELSDLLGTAVRYDVPLARLTSLRVGGPVDAVASPASRAQLCAALGRLARARVPHHVIGGGFNSLALDAPVAGVAIQLPRWRRLEERPGHTLRVEAGVSHSQLTRFCCDRGFAGLEFGAGIPGTIGGWIAMNAGIPGREVGDRVVEIEVASPTGARISHLPRAVLHFGYRSLRGLAPGSVILSALLRIERSTPAAVRAEVAELLARREKTQPLSVPSCGSVFKNPPGDYAGRLIEAAGLKGHRVGGAQISPLHANFIANLGGATASDVMELIRLAKERVRAQSGTRLECEVRIVGGAA
ncbi:MAG TPA: UDP-N-acetylmuramate dehydrogenase [Myxococcota bacterium]|nr:UDP-N-acetylmuramate dehydrogenase [Myxococcota bacterium]